MTRAEENDHPIDEPVFLAWDATAPDKRVLDEKNKAWQPADGWIDVVHHAASSILLFHNLMLRYNYSEIYW